MSHSTLFHGPGGFLRRLLAQVDPGLVLALLIYALLAAFTVGEVGLVGEVAIGWALGEPPAVLLSTEPLTWADGLRAPGGGHRLGPLLASQVRPTEALIIGPLSLPLAINSYTGGLADWPARLVWGLTGSTAAVTFLHVALGGLFLALLHRFLAFHGSRLAAGIAAVLLATDWSFVFYRKVLGGTELLLLAGLLLAWWALWSRRWAAGRHGLLALAVGVGLALLAKITAALSLAALVLTALLTRWDKPRLRPPLPGRLWQPALALALLLSPLAVAALHQALAVPAEGHLVSHDFPGLQLERVAKAVSGGEGPVREGLGNLGLWAGTPLRFFELAYAAQGAPPTNPWRLVGWVVVALGVLLGWRDRHPTPSQALLRFTSVFLVLQVGLVGLVARDLHHLAVATPTACVLAGLALERVAALTTPRHSLARLRNAALLALPWALAGAAALLRTDGVVATIPVPTFTTSGQAALAALLEEEEVSRLVVADYESYGLLEVIRPEARVVHGWGAVASERGEALPQLLALAEGGHFLTVQASAKMVYNLRPSTTRLQTLAREQGLEVRVVGALEGEEAVLYEVRKTSP